jgi:hypothetical protein
VQAAKPAKAAAESEGERMPGERLPIEEPYQVPLEEVG